MARLFPIDVMIRRVKSGPTKGLAFAILPYEIDVYNHYASVYFSPNEDIISENYFEAINNSTPVHPDDPDAQTLLAGLRSDGIEPRVITRRNRKVLQALEKKG